MKIQTNTKHHHRIVPIIILTFAIPIAIIGGWLAFANAFTHDEAPPNDSMLLLPDVEVSDADNAYPDIQQLNTAVTAIVPLTDQPVTDVLVDDMLNGKTWDEAHAIEVLKKYTAPIANFHAAAKKPQYQNPAEAHPSTWTGFDLPTNTSNLRFASKLVSIEALRKARSGDVAGGLSDAIEVVKIGHTIESGQGTLMEWLVASNVKQIGLEAIRQIGLQTTLTADQIKLTSQQLEQYRDTLAGLITATKFEYAGSASYRVEWEHLDTLYRSYSVGFDINGKEVAPPGLWMLTALDYSGLTRFYYWPNQSWRFLIEKQERLVTAVQADCMTGDLNPPRQAHSRRTGYGRLLEPNAIGKMLADLGEISMGGVATKRCDKTLAISATQTVLAISAYQNDNQKLPETLDILVPEYLSSVPVDPYNGKALGYDPARKIVYSIGQDRKDENGNTNKMNDYTSPGGDWQNMFDPTFIISQ